MSLGRALNNGGLTLGGMAGRTIGAAPTNIGIVPDSSFDSGSVGNWVSSREDSILSIAAGKLLVTRNTTTCGASIDLAGLISPGDYRIRMAIGFPGSRPYMIVRMSYVQGLTGTNINIYAATPSADINLDQVVTVDDKTWFGVITTWTNSATEFTLDDVWIEPVA